jgi:predicted transcriptional regulator of viral defense system
MEKNLTKKIFFFIKKKEVVTIEEIRKKFIKENPKTISYHLNKCLEFGIKKIRKGIYSTEYSGDRFLLLMKLDKENVLAYHTALEFYGLGHSMFYTNFIMNKKNIPEIEDLDGISIKFVKPTINNFYKIIRNNIEFRVTSLEATLVDCLLNLKYCGGFEEFFRCLEGVERTNEIKFKKNRSTRYEKVNELNLNYILELLEKYKIRKLYNLVGFTLENLQKKLRIKISEKFLSKLKKLVRRKPVYLEKSYKKKYIVDNKWNVRYPVELKSTLTGVY